MRRILALRWHFFDQAMVSASNFLIGVVLVRLFGVEEYGIYVLLWAVVQFTQSFQNALITAPMQTVAPTMGSAQGAYYSATVRWYVLFSLLSGVLVFSVAKAGEDFLPDFWHSEYAVSLAAWIISMQLQDGIRRWLIARGRERRAFMADAIAYPGQVAVIVYVASVGHTLATAIFCISGILTVSALAGGLVGSLLDSAKGISLKETWNLNWSSSRWLAGTAVLQWLSGNYVLITAAVILGPATTGAIRAAQNLLAITHVLFQGLENIVPVRAAEQYCQNGWKALIDYAKSISFLLITATGSIAVITMLFAKPILELFYGRATQDSIVAAVWFVPIYLVIAATLPARTVIRVIGKTRSIFIGNIFSSILAITFSTPIAKMAGINGVMALILTINIASFIPILIAIHASNNSEKYSI